MLQEWAQAALRAAAEGGPMVFVAIAFATLLSEDLTCIATGLLVAQGTLGLAPAIVACYFGILGGDMLLVLIGRTLGRRSLQHAPLRWWARPALVARAEHWFLRRGPVLIFASRFMPGTRVAAYFAAGALRVPMGRFIGWFALACAIWTPLLVGGTVLFGEAALRLFKSWASVAPALLVAGIAAWLAAKAAVNLSTWRGRRLVLGRWRRLTRWQFWPTWFLHVPVACHVGWLGLRHRSLTLFTTVNPGVSPRGEADERTAPADTAQSVRLVVSCFRRPEGGPLEILSLAERSPLFVTGDGRRSIEQLVLADDLAVSVGAFLSAQLGARADEVPAAGERVLVCASGRQARGILWFDGAKHLSPRFEAKLAERLAARTNVFLGAWEVRAASEDALQRGEFEVGALRGLLTAPLHIYDPHRGAGAAWRLLRREWRLAFAIAKHHRARGAKALAPGETWRLLIAGSGRAEE